MEIWTPKVEDDSLYLRCEDRNEHDEYAAAVMIEGQTGGHIPKNFSKIFKLFLLFQAVSLNVKLLESV